MNEVNPLAYVLLGVIGVTTALIVVVRLAQARAADAPEDPDRPQTLAEYMAGRTPKGHRPVPYLNVDANAVHWFWKDEDCHGESVHADGWWVGTVHRSDATGEAVGVTIFLEAVRTPADGRFRLQPA